MVFLVSLVIKLLGAWMKITQQANADLLLTIGFFGQILAPLIAFIVVARLLFTRKANDPSNT
ncbi:hypothetical protein [Paraflavitalea pollutisoli]|uniref:hypothetical protein n=1 Tax=Paraflavitalea pollutisoli TaxID=3034143 RepID=UPI0023EC2A49|nr:hypothetical protein [Paraflavitalea sp. H1-2-19X]